MKICRKLRVCKIFICDSDQFHQKQKVACNTAISAFFLFGSETWSDKRKEEHSLRVLRIFGPKREEVVGGCRRLHSEDLHNLYTSPNTISVIKSRRMRWAGHVARMGEMRNSYKVLAEKSEGKRPLGITRRRLEDNIKMNIRQIG
jgi:hypothetical protein